MTISINFRICLQLRVLSMWGVGGLQEYGFFCSRYVFSEAIEAGSNYQIFCLWWIRNNTCGDSTISTRIEKGRVGVSPRLVWRKTRGGMIWFSVSEALLDDWAIGGSIDVFLTYGMVLVLWGFKDKIMLHCFREVNCQQFYSRNLM